MGIPPLCKLHNTIPIHILPFAAECLETINRRKVPKTACFRDFSVGAVGGIRTLVPLLTTTRFPEMV